MTNSRNLNGAGCLIINADDWGRDAATTNRTLDCIRYRTVSSVSAMVFMEDSERAAEIASNHNLDAGLHLNLTAPLTGTGLPADLLRHQEAISRYLAKSRYSQSIFHPALANSFQYCISAQIQEFAKLYGDAPQRMDGHHHMHLSANVILGHLLPDGMIIRRNFSFGPGEKSFPNRLYRRVTDAMLARRHPMTDFFFSLQPIAPADRLQRLFSMANHFVVELESHPVNDDEYNLLTGDKLHALLGDVTISVGYFVRSISHYSVQ